MSKGLKFFGSLVLILALIAVALWGAFTWFTRQAFPQTSGNIKIDGIQSPVEIVRDEHGVAHIYAQNSADLFFAQGYVHAQERFWQMEFQRRVGSGRLSEIFGENTLETDIYLRHYGFTELAAQAYELMDPDTQKIVDAYTAGINAYIGRRSPARLGLEFALLGVQGVTWDIEPWTQADALIWSEMMIFDQAGDANDDLNNLQRWAALGSEKYMDMRPDYRSDRPVIIPSEELDYLKETETAQSAPLGQAEIDYLLSFIQQRGRTGLAPQQLVDLGFLGTAGSNSFVVSGDLTATGKPLLANDPHMGVNMPALWYEIGMHCVEKSTDCPYSFRGFSLPGVPGILIGHNDRIAWGLTNASFDAEDVFIERINPQNPNQYEVNGEWIDMEIRREEIQVRGQAEPVNIQVRSTRNGVIVSDRMVDNLPFSYQDGEPVFYALSFAWTALEPIQSAQAVFMVNKAQNWEEFVDALQYFDAGKQNWVYADVDGNIGYIMPGKVPVRAGGDGSLPVPGWTDEYIWTGFVPYDQAPRAFNPAQGFIATANNPQVRTENYPFNLGVFHDRGQRAQRITEMIQSDPDGVSLADMIAIQTDNKSLSAMEIIPYLNDLSFDNPVLVSARDRLQTWDGQMGMDSPEAALFNIFWVHLVQGTYADQLPEDLMLSGESYTSDMVYGILEKPTSAWWDDKNTPDVAEDRDFILEQAFEQAYAEGTEQFSEDLNTWRWGDLHTITFRNATLGNSGISLIENIFNRGPFPTNGSESVVQKTCWSINSPYAVRCIPALRQVVDLSNLSNSRVIHSVGQSGHPMHPQYDNFIEDWRFFRYHPSNWTRADAQATKHEVLTLQPNP
jgi:penicillin G amidase